MERLFGNHLLPKASPGRRKIFSILAIAMLLFLSGCGKLKGSIKNVLRGEPLIAAKFIVDLDQADLQISEGSSALISVTLSEKQDHDVVVFLTSTGLNALSNLTGFPSQVTIPAGSLSAPIVINVADNTKYDSDRTLIFTLSSNEDGVGFGVKELKIKVLNNDPLPQVSFTQNIISLTEGNTAVSIGVQLDRASEFPVSVNYGVSGGTATVGVDYDAFSGTLVFAPDETSKTLSLMVRDDAMPEVTEQINLALSGVSGATLGSASSMIIQILDNDSSAGPFNITGITGTGDSVVDANLNAGVVATVNWQASAGAVSYQVGIFEDDGTTVKCPMMVSLTTSYAFSGCNLTGGNFYKAQVTAVSGSVTLDAANSQYRFFVNRSPTVAQTGPWLVQTGSNVVITMNGSAPTFGATDADTGAGDAVTITAAGNGTKGTTNFTANSVTYTPTGANLGSDSFSVTFSDTHGGSTVVTANVVIATAFTWTGLGGNNLWSTPGNWFGGVVPGASDIALFMAACSGTQCNATIDNSVSIAGVQLMTGYTGTLTQGAGNTLTVGSSGYSQSAGNFAGGNAGIILNGNFALSGGNFTSTSATLAFRADMAITNTPVFNANAGTVSFYRSTAAAAINPGTVAFNNVSFIGNQATFTLAANMNVNGTLTVADTFVSANDINGFSILAAGDVVFANNGYRGSTKIRLVGSGNQSVSGVSTAWIPDFEIASTGGTVTFTGTLKFYRSFSWISGATNISAATVNFTGSTSTPTLIPGPMVFGDVNFVGNQTDYNLTGNMTVNGTLSLSDTFTSGNNINGGNILAAGNVNLSNYGYCGTGTLRVVGSTNQTISGVSTACTPNFEIASTGGTVTLSGTIKMGKNFTHTSGAVTTTGSTVVFSNTSTITPNTVVFNDVSFASIQGAFSIVGSLNINGNLSLDDTGASGNSVSGGNIFVKGNVTATNKGYGGTTNLEMNGASSANLSVAATASLPGQLIINKTAANVQMLGNVSLSTTGQDLTISSGTLKMAGYNLTVNDFLTINAGATLDTGCGTYLPNSLPKLVNNGTILGGTTTPQVSIADASVTEGGQLSFVVSWNQAVCTSGITVDYATADGTATVANSDYTAKSGTLTIPTGPTLNATIIVNTTSDIIAEANEIMYLNLSNLSAGTILDNQAIGTIVNDDSDPFMWTGLAGDGLWTTGGNWFGGAAPGAGNVAIFNNLCTNCNATIDTNISVTGIRLDAGYTGTLNQMATRTITLSTSGFAQGSGVFQGGNANFTNNGSFIVSGGAFNAPSATYSQQPSSTTSFNLGSASVFNANGGTVVLGGSGCLTMNVFANGKSFQNLNFINNCMTLDLNSSNFNVLGNLLLGNTWSAGIGMNNGTINVSGNVTVQNYGVSGNAVIRLAGNASGQTIAGQIYSQPWPSDVGRLPSVMIDTGSNPVTITNVIAVAQSWNVTSVGTLTTAGSGLLFPSSGHSVTPGSVNYNDVEFRTNAAAPTANTLNSGTMKVYGKLKLGNQWNYGTQLNSGTFEAYGDLDISDYGYGGTAVVKVMGKAGGQTITGITNLGVPQIQTLEIAAGANPVTLSGAFGVNLDYRLTSSGTFTATGSTFHLAAGSSATLNVRSGAVTYGNVLLESSGGNIDLNSQTLKVGGTLTAGNLSSTSVQLNSGVVETYQNVTFNNYGFAGNAQFKFFGTAQSLTKTAAVTLPSGQFTVGNGVAVTTLDLVNDINLSAVGQPLLLDANSIINMNGKNLNVAGTLTLNAGSVINTGCGVLTYGTLTSNGGSINGGTTTPQVSIADASVTEGGQLNFSVSWNQPVCSVVTVDYATADGTATVANNDYTAKSGTLTIPTGTTLNTTVTVNTTADSTIEPNEIMYLNLSNLSSGAIADNQAIGTIVNDDASPFMWTGATGDGLWTTAGNWFGGSVPGASDVAIFANLCTNCNAAVNSNISIAGLLLYAGYTGTLTQNSGNTIDLGSSGYSQGSGTFSGGNSAITINGSYQLSGGNFTSTSGTLSLPGNWAVTGTPVFSAHGGVLRFSGNSASYTIVPGNVTYNTVNFDSFSAFFDLSGGNMVVAGNLLVSDQWPNSHAINSGTLSVAGNVTASNYGHSGSAWIKLTGNASGQTVTGNAARLLNIEVAAGLNNVTLSGETIVGSYRLSSVGTLTTTGSTLTFDGWSSSYDIYPGTATYNNVRFIGYASIYDLHGENFSVDGTLTLADQWPNSRAINNGVILSSGNISVSQNGYSGSAVLRMVGKAGGQTLNGTGSAAYLPKLEIATGAYPVTITGSPIVTVGYTYFNSGTFTAAGSNLKMSCSTGSTCNVTPGTVHYGNVNFDFSGTIDLQSSVFNIDGDLNLSSWAPGALLTNGTLAFAGNLTATSFGVGGNAALTFVGTTQSANTSASALPNGTVTIGNASTTPTVNMQTNFSFNSSGQDLTVFSGTLNMNGHTLTVNDYLTINTGATLVTGCAAYTPNTLPKFVNNGTIINGSNVSLTIDDVTVNEGSNATLTVTLSGANCTNTTFDFATVDGTALAGNHYTATSGSKTITTGNLTTTIAVTTLDNNIYEAAKQFNVVLSNPANAVIADNTGIVTVNNIDSLPSLAIDDVSVNENAGTVTFTVTKTGSTALAASVDYATSNGTATAGSDYTATSGTLNIPAANPSGTITVNIMDDGTSEANETFNVTLSNPVNATISDNTGIGTIIDNDTTLGVFAINGITGGTDTIADNWLNGDSASPTVSWNAATNATSYDVTIYLNDGTTVKCSTQNTTSLSLSMAPCTLVGGTTYKAKVTAKNGSNLLDASNSLYNFTYQLSSIPDVPMVVQSNDNSKAGTSVSVTFSASNTVGNLIVVNCYSSSTTTTMAVSDTLGNTYSLANAASNAGIGKMTLYYAANVLPGPNTITCNYNTSATIGIEVAEISGVVANFPVDASSNGSGTSINPSFNVSTGFANDIIVGVLDGGTQRNPGAGYLSLNTNSRMMINVVGATGTYAVNAKLTSSHAWAGVAASFKAKGGTNSQSAIYAMGGTNWSFNSYIEVLRSYDGYSWTATGRLPSHRDSGCGLWFNNSLWYISGYDGSTTTTQVLKSTNGGLSWTVAGNFPSTGRNGAACMVYNNKMWVIGGDNTYNAAGAQNTVLSSSDGVTWTSVGTIPGKRSEIQGVVFNNKMWVAGGTDETGAYHSEVYWSTDGVTWSTVGAAALPAARKSAGFTVYNNKMWFIGGTASGNSPTSSVYNCGDPCASWASTSLPTALQLNQAVSFRGNLMTVWSDQTSRHYASVDGTNWSGSAGRAFDPGSENQRTSWVTSLVVPGASPEPRIEYLQSVENATVVSSNSIASPNFSAGVGKGNFLICRVVYNNNSTTLQTMTSNAGDIFTKAVGPTAGSGSIANWRGEVWYATNVAGGSAVNVTANFSTTFATDKRIFCSEYIGVAKSNPVDVTATNTGNGAGASVNFSPASFDLIYTSSLCSTLCGAGNGYNLRYTTLGDPVTDVFMKTGGNITVPMSSVGDWLMQAVALKADSSYQTAPGITLAASFGTINETDPTATVTFTLSQASSSDVTFNWSTFDGSARAGNDYTATSETGVVIPAGQTQITRTIPLLDDTTDENNENFYVYLTNVVGATASIGTATIIDDDGPPSLGITDVTKAENGGTATFTVSLSAASGKTVTVDYATADNTATAGSDYTATSGTLTFNPGVSLMVINVPILQDTNYEGTETAYVLLSNATNATIFDNSGLLTITDDETAPTLAINDVSVNESAGTMTFTVTKTGATTVTASVDYVTSNGTATSGSDYTATSGTLNIPAANPSGTITVNISDDAIAEGDETLNVTLSNAVNATIADNTGIGTITNDDAPTLTNISPNTGVDTGGTSLTLTGTGFLSGMTATVGGNTCTSPSVTNSTTFTCVTPAGTAGAVDVVISNSAGSQPSGTRTATSTGGFTYTVASSPPTVVLSVPNGLSVIEKFQVFVQFDQSVTGVALGDFSVINGTKGNLTGSGATYSFFVTPTSFGTVLISMPANGAQNAALQGNTASNSLSVTYESQVYATISPPFDAYAETNGTLSKSFTVTLNASKSYAVNIGYQLITQSTATNPTDHDLVAGVVNFPSGSTSQTIPFSYFGNSTLNADKILGIRLTTSDRAAVSTNLPQGIHYITDDDGTSAYFTQVSNGQRHGCGITNSGDLYCWGRNSQKQLGDGTTTSHYSPTLIDGGVSYSAVSAGVNHTCGITSANVLKCWGDNTYSQLGDGTTTASATPKVIDSGVSYTKIATGDSYTCGITSTSVLKCWGANDVAQLGDTTLVHPRSTPVVIDSGVSYTEVTAGAENTCGITSTGVLKCWGENYNGEVGDNSTTQRSTPTVINSGTSYSKVSQGFNHACAITTAGVLKCWGNTLEGQVGDNSWGSRLTPVVINSGTTYSSVSAGNMVTCGVTTAGVLKCWGDGNYGANGSGGRLDIGSPQVVESSVNYSSVSVGYFHGCGITTTNVMKCWGTNADGQLGDGTLSGKSTAVVADSGVNYSTVSGASHTCAITSGGTLKCWGLNDWGQLGDGSTTSKTSPISIDSSVAYAKVDAGGNHTCAITTAGMLKCWGLNNFGQVGNSANTSYVRPVVIDPGTTYSSVSAGYQHTCGITTAGVLKCWGLNSSNELGDGTSTSRSTPTVIDSGTTYIALTVGDSHSCGITSTNVLKCWGYNGSGQVGDGTTVDKNTPTVIDTGVAYSAVAAGFTHTCGVVSATGGMKCWGGGDNGQIGDGTFNNRMTPRAIDAGVVYTFVSTGDYQSCGITNTGALKCWGTNVNGEVGDGTFTDRTTPVVSDSGTNYSVVNTGYGQTCGVTTSGALRCWGTNMYGQLGNGSHLYVQPWPVLLDTSCNTSDFGLMQSGYNQGSGTVNLTLPAAQVAGNTNIVVIGWPTTTGSVTSVTDSKGNSYSVAVGPHSRVNAGSQVIYYASNIAAATLGSNVVTVTTSGAGTVSAKVFEYSGLATSGALDAVAYGTASGTNAATANLTTTNSCSLLFASTWYQNTFSAVGGGYAIADTVWGDLVAQKVVNTTGTYNASSTHTPTGDYVAQLVAFKKVSSVKPAIALKQKGSVSDSNTTSTNILLSQAQTSGNLNVVVVAYANQTNTVSSVTDTAGNTYTLAVGPTVNTTASTTQYIYYAKNIAGVSNNRVTITFNSTNAGYIYAEAFEYSGLSTTSPLDVTATGTSYSGTPTTNSVTTNYSNELVITSFFVSVGSPNVYVGSGYSYLDLNSTGNLSQKAFTQQKIMTTTGSVYGDGSMSSSQFWIMQLVTFH